MAPKTGITRYAHRDISYLQFFRLNGSCNDSLKASPNRSYTLAHQISWKTSTFKYFDNSPAN